MKRSLCALTAMILATAATAGSPTPSSPAGIQPASDATAAPVDQRFLDGLSWRGIGPARGGRAQACSGVPGDPMTYYMGATGGGVWKTTDAGNSWRNITDGFIGTGSVGDVEVAPSDPNVVYVGMGEADIRGNFSHGDGMYKSVDAGETWTHIGLEDTRQIGRVAVHPDDPNTVFVAALGHVFGPNAQRGVFRSTDGGETWQKMLYINDRTGAVDVRFDPVNPRIIYAGLWQVHRTPWSLSSGGEHSGLYRSRDGGETWQELTSGLPRGIKGKISVAPSPAQRNLVYAMVEAEDGGVFRSSNGGDSWRRVNDDRSLRQRAWYYTHIYADTQDPDTCYVMNVGFHKSTDGGETFGRIRVPHSDNHDLWIAPEDNLRMINANDGGANVSFNGGNTWSTQTNQPTAQFYHVTVDNNFPYRVYGAQQDNSTASVSSRGNPLRWERDFYSVGGGESGYIAVHPENPDIVYAGSYSGYLTRYDHAMRKTRNVTVWPENPMGGGVGAVQYRFQWTFPILFSPHDPNTVYAAGNVLFKTTDEGTTWQAISPDLTTNDPTKQGASGGPITKDNTGVEYYCTIFAVAESPIEPGLIWAGSDDGLVHVTSNGGETWTEVTPPGMGDWPLISLIEASPHDPDTCYLAVTRYKMNDFTPYIYRTRDRGKTWDLITRGIDDGAFVRAVREDPIRQGLLYAGTETGMYVSFDDGEHWQSLQQNLPVVPITDLVIKDDDIVLATQGRSFWIMDDISVLRQINSEIARADMHVFDPPAAYRQRWDRVRLQYHLADHLAEDGVDVTVDVLDHTGSVLRSFDQSSSRAGMNEFTWNMRLENPTRVPGAVGWPGPPSGPRVVPGTYTAHIHIGDAEPIAREFQILGDPRVDTTADEYSKQFDMLMDIHHAIDEVHRTINDIRRIRSQIDATLARARGHEGLDAIKQPAQQIKQALTDIEETLIQTRSKSAQDPLNFPVKLNDKISALAGNVDGDYGPTKQTRDVFEHLMAQVQSQIDSFNRIVSDDVPSFNDLVHEQRIPAIIIEDDHGDE